MKNSFLILFVTVSILISNVEATIVFDPTNFSRNTVTAVQTTRQTAVQLNQYYQQVLMLKNMYQNTMRLPNQAITAALLGRPITNPADFVSEIDFVTGNVSTVLRNLQNMQNAYQGLQHQTTELNKIAVNAGIPSGRILQVEAQQVANHQQSSSQFLQAFASLQAQIQDNQTRNDNITRQLNLSDGIVQSLQNVGMQNRLLSDQLNQFLSLSALQAQQKTQDMANSDSENQARLQKRQQFLQIRQQNLNKWSGQNGN